MKQWSIAVAILAGVIIASYIFLIRPWHMRWGATAEEIAMTFPGDRFIAPNWDISTRVITIHAPAATVWQWLVQIGQGRHPV